MRSSSLFFACAACSLLAVVAPNAAAQMGGAQQPRAARSVVADDSLVLQTYEIGDLVFSVPDYTLDAGSATNGAHGGSPRGGGGGGMMGGGGGGFGRGMGMGGGGFGAEGGATGQVMLAPGASPLTIDAIIQVIQATVAPNSWQAAGTGEGQATALGTSLVVLQTPDAQEAISGLLTALREGSGSRRSMTVDARWLVLDSDGLDKLLVVGEDGERRVNREALAAFTRQTTSLRAMVNCFSGQAVYLTSGTVRSSVSSYIPVVGSIESPKPDVKFASYPSDGRISFVSDEQTSGFGGGRSVGYQPVIATNNFGVEFQVRPTRLHPEKAAVVDLRSTITFPADDSAGREKVEAREETFLFAPKVDRVAIQTQELATTLRVPLGEPVLVGGMTDVATTGGESAERPQLYLVLEVR